MSATGSVALVTPSYAGDLERARLLADTVDHHVTGHSEHLILVDPADLDLFRPLAGPKRRIVDERELLPGWLHRATQPGGRRLWWSLKTWPMRGWHVQQLRRIAIARTGMADAFLYCDSDMAFVRPFDVGDLWRGDALRLYRVPEGVGAHLPDGGAQHMAWTRHAAAILGLPAPDFPAADYINNLVSWRGDHVRALCERIEAETGRHWVAALGRARRFSECQVYGAFADGVAAGAGHWPAASGLARTYWAGEALTEAGLRAFADGMEVGQVGLGIQSFTDTDPNLLRRIALG